MFYVIKNTYATNNNTLINFFESHDTNLVDTCVDILVDFYDETLIHVKIQHDVNKDIRVVLALLLFAYKNKTQSHFKIFYDNADIFFNCITPKLKIKGIYEQLEKFLNDMTSKKQNIEEITVMFKVKRKTY